MGRGGNMGFSTLLGDGPFGVGGISTPRGERRVDTALWAPKRAQLTGPQNPTETDPRQRSLGKKQKWDFGNQRVEGAQKSHHLPCIW